MMKLMKYIISHSSIICFLMCFFEIFSDDFYAKFHQVDYKIDFQRIELLEYSKSYLNFVEVKNFKYNRTRGVINATLNSKVNMSTELEVAVEAYKFLSNEYRKLPGTNFQLNYCKSVQRNIAGLEILFKRGNFSPTCQILQETTYKVWNLYPDESRFPPFLPNGEFKLLIDIFYGNENVAKLAGYMRVYRPITIAKKHSL